MAPLWKAPICPSVGCTRRPGRMDPGGTALQDRFKQPGRAGKPEHPTARRAGGQRRQLTGGPASNKYGRCLRGSVYDDPGCYDPFRLVGNWWMPDAPEERIAGSLDWSPRGATLALAGSLGVSRGRPMHYPVIHGTVGLGQSVTLCGCRPTELTQRGGLAEERIGAQWALVGAHFGGGADARFKSVTAGLTLLDRWVGISGFDLGGDGGGAGVAHSVRYKKPADIAHAAEDGTEVEIMFGHFADIARAPVTRVCITQSCEVAIRPRGGMNLREAAGRVRGLQRLVSIAMLEPSYPIRMRVEGEDGATASAYGAEISAHEMRVRGRPDEADFLGVPLPYERLAEGFGEFYRKWSDAQRELDSVCGLYFDTVFLPDMALEEQVNSLVRAAESFHRRDGSGGKCSLPKRLASLLGRFPAAAKGRDPGDLASSAAGVRDYLSHYWDGPPPKDTSIGGLLALHARMSALVEACLLSRAGLGDAEIAEFVRHSLFRRSAGTDDGLGLDPPEGAGPAGMWRRDGQDQGGALT